jgi:hypothetical protein
VPRGRVKYSHGGDSGEGYLDGGQPHGELVNPGRFPASDGGVRRRGCGEHCKNLDAMPEDLGSAQGRGSKPCRQREVPVVGYDCRDNAHLGMALRSTRSKTQVLRGGAGYLRDEEELQLFQLAWKRAGECPGGAVYGRVQAPAWRPLCTRRVVNRSPGRASQRMCILHRLSFRVNTTEITCFLKAKTPCMYVIL